MESELQFDFSYAPGTTWEQIVAFETAGELWSEYMTDNMTVNIHVEMTNVLPDNVIGGALPAMVADVSYAQFRDAYEADITSQEDEGAFTGLPLTTKYGEERFEARVDLGSDSFVGDSDNLDLTRANAKALGLVDSHSSELDGYIIINDLADAGVSWSNNVYQTDNNQLDLFSLAVHEVGHVLGFVSGVDKSEGLSFNNQVELLEHFNNSNHEIREYLNATLDRANPMDLFRYSSESQTLDNSSNTIDMSFGSDAFFARNGNNRNWNFARGKNEDLSGDGHQASHWQSKNNEIHVHGIMDPVLKTGINRRVTNRDLIVMNSIGYDLTSDGLNLLQQANSANGWHTADKSQELIERLQWQAKDHIAKSVSSSSNAQAWWVDWWAENRPEYADRYVNQDRTEDVQAMIDNSEVYEGRRSRSSSYSRQEAFWQSAYFSEFSWQEFNSELSTSNEFSATLMVEVANTQSIAASDNNSNLSQKSQQILATENQNSVVVTEVTMNLLAIAEQESETVSTESETELLSEFSLYGQELAQSDLQTSLV